MEESEKNDLEVKPPNMRPVFTAPHSLARPRPRCATRDLCAAELLAILRIIEEVDCGKKIRFDDFVNPDDEESVEKQLNISLALRTLYYGTTSQRF
jgi:hypothetical protein